MTKLLSRAMVDLGGVILFYIFLHFILSLNNALFSYDAGKTERQSLPEARK